MKVDARTLVNRARCKSPGKTLLSIARSPLALLSLPMVGCSDGEMLTPRRDGAVAVDARPSEDVAGMDATAPAEDAAIEAGMPAVDGAAGPDAGRAVEDRCEARETCGDGLDNDCNGSVDENCPCIPGSVQRCFVGPPGRRALGTCTDGNQTCLGSGEFGTWGACTGGIAPRAEVCDGADNDCNGVVDDALACRPAGRCPAAGDPRVPTGRPFAEYRLDGAAFFTGTARAWRWRVTGGPCDQLLYATRTRVSYQLGGASAADPRESAGQTLAFTPTLSGDYTVTLTVTPAEGPPFECTFVVAIRAPGVRFELCWDRTGPIDTTGTDVDFWLHDPRNRGDWGQIITDDTCGPWNCFNRATDNPLAVSRPNWGYGPTVGGSCRRPDGTNCNNPRLDVDNNGRAGTTRSDSDPENINVDNPRDGDRFRVAAVYFRGTGAVQPLVNIYCGGALRATFGGATVGGMLYGSTPITGFNTGGRNESGSLWRVADVVMREPADTCDVIPLVAASGSGPCVQNGTDRSFDGPCRPRP
jgi:hypothetical protein